MFIDRITEWKLKCSSKTNMRIVVTADLDDKTMNNEWIQSFCKAMDAEINYHDKNTKISAVNADIPAEGWDYLILVSDDMICIQNNWNETVEKVFEDTKKGVIWFDDGLNHHLDTFCVMTREYYNRFGYIYNPEYVSVYCDNEFTEVAIILDELVKAEPSIVKHNWVGNTCKDELHMRNETKEHYEKDGELFKLRRANKYFLK